MTDEVADIRITDNELRRRVEAERKRRGDSTLTKTAGKLLLERLHDIDGETERDADHSPNPSPTLA